MSKTKLQYYFFMSVVLGSKFSLLESIGKHHIRCISLLCNNEHIVCNHPEILGGGCASCLVHTVANISFLT